MYNGSQYAMVLIKNVKRTPKEDWYLKEQHYTILTRVVDEVIWICILQLHNKLSSAQFTFKEVNSFPFLCIIQYSFSNLHIKHQTKPNVHFITNYIKNYNEKYKIM